MILLLTQVLLSTLEEPILQSLSIMQKKQQSIWMIYQQKMKLLNNRAINFLQIMLKRKKNNTINSTIIPQNHRWLMKSLQLQNLSSKIKNKKSNKNGTLSMKPKSINHNSIKTFPVKRLKKMTKRKINNGKTGTETKTIFTTAILEDYQTSEILASWTASYNSFSEPLNLENY